MNGINKCPYCGEEKIIKYGKFEEVQRYKCKNKDCAKTFSDVTNTEFYYSKKAKIYLSEYAKLMYERLTLREIVYAMKVLFEKITLRTAFLWRHKILKILGDTNEGYKSQGLIEAINFRTKENHKGDKKIEKKTREWVHTVVSFDSMSRSNPKTISIGRITYPKVKEKLEEIIEKDTIFFCKGGAFFSIFKRQHNPQVEIEEPNKFLKDNIYVIIKRWLKTFRGVRTKNIEKYLSWFIVEYKIHMI